MDEASDILFEAGLLIRQRVLGDAWVDTSLANRTAFNSDYQVFITRIAWQEIWAGRGWTTRLAAWSCSPSPQASRAGRSSRCTSRSTKIGKAGKSIGYDLARSPALIPYRCRVYRRHHSKLSFGQGHSGRLIHRKKIKK
ncbi:hypothetical protein [Sphingobium phenoxybenzoativorans]|uniref:hypothetical protein n=1 Tax=Sphingobium phenoxybenzoativorans TaxID=1592790 RepID=UPI00209B318E|nr:hypothetical protein [Sphingobium phenoxybenzoativorans]